MVSMRMTRISLGLGCLLALGCKTRSHGGDDSGTLRKSTEEGTESSTVMTRLQRVSGVVEVSQLKQQGQSGISLLGEAKLESLLPSLARFKYEASGIAFYENALYVVLDNQYRALIQIPVELSGGSASLSSKGAIAGIHGLDIEKENRFDMKSKAGFEGITVVKRGGQDMMYLLQEARWKDSAYKNSKPRSKLIDDTNPEFTINGGGFSRFFPHGATDGNSDGPNIEHQGFNNRLTLTVPFETSNKGFEGISNLTVGATTYILALCEGNSCLSEDQNVRKFDGIITIFADKGQDWRPIARISLKDRVPFLDFSDMAIQWNEPANSGKATGKILITSQTDAAIWSADIALDISDSSASATFSNERFFVLGADLGYCNIEGITWIDAKQGLIALASDSAKSDVSESSVCQDKDQSVHILKLGS
jgi:hypothetical protein